jgi:hypothetical protein
MVAECCKHRGHHQRYDENEAKCGDEAQTGTSTDQTRYGQTFRFSLPIAFSVDCISANMPEGSALQYSGGLRPNEVAKLRDDGFSAAS